MRRGALWLVYFLISLGLGYPTLNRYDPRETGGLSDTQSYYELAVHGSAEVDPQLRSRVLVPMLVRPIAAMAEGHVGTWNPVFLGFLIVNSLFTATTASLLADVAERLAGGEAIAVLSGALYLLNFETANVVLSGMVDSADGCFLMAMVWSLLSERAWWLPVWGLLGAASKETFVPLSMVFLLVWWLVERRDGKAMVAAAFAALVGIAALQSVVAGHVTMPWNFAGSVGAASGHWQALADNTIDRSIVFMAIWLVPAGVLRLRAMPKAWAAASGAAAMAALGLAVWHSSSAGAAARPYFTVAGPLLSLSAARWLGRG